MLERRAENGRRVGPTHGGPNDTSSNSKVLLCLKTVPQRVHQDGRRRAVLEGGPRCPSRAGAEARSPHLDRPRSTPVWSCPPAHRRTRWCPAPRLPLSLLPATPPRRSASFYSSSQRFSSEQARRLCPSVGPWPRSWKTRSTRPSSLKSPVATGRQSSERVVVRDTSRILRANSNVRTTPSTPFASQLSFVIGSVS